MPKYPVPSVNSEYEQVGEVRMEANVEPTPAQSTRFTRTGRSYTPSNVTAYKKLVAEYGRAAVPDDWDKGLHYAVDYEFFVSTHHRKDVDNLSKPVSDALNGIFWEDDAQVFELLVTKVYSPGCPGLRATIRSYRVKREDPSQG